MRLFTVIALAFAERTKLYLSAVIVSHGDAGGLEAGEINFSHKPVKEGEDRLEWNEAHRVGRERLVDGAVSETQIDVLIGDSGLSLLAFAVTVGV